MSPSQDQCVCNDLSEYTSQNGVGFNNMTLYKTHVNCFNARMSAHFRKHLSGFDKDVLKLLQ